jgi:hypothetical protein
MLAGGTRTGSFLPAEHGTNLFYSVGESAAVSNFLPVCAVTSSHEMVVYVDVAWFKTSLKHYISVYELGRLRTLFL